MEFKLIFYTIVLAAYIMFFTFLSPLNKKGDNILGLLFIIFGGFFTLTGFKVILDLYQSNSTFDGSSVIKNILKEPVKYYEIKQNINEPEFTSLALQIFDEWLDEGLIKIN